MVFFMLIKDFAAQVCDATVASCLSYCRAQKNLYQYNP